MTSKKNNTNPVLWFFFVIVIPSIVALTLTVIILTVAGVDVKGWAVNTGSKIPGVSNFVKTQEEKDIEVIETKNQEKIAAKDAEIEKLIKQISDMEDQVEHLEHELIKSEKKLDIDDQESEELDTMNDNETESMKTIAASFRKMKSKEAALIFSKLDKATAISLLSELSNDVRGLILEAMEPELAAELTELFINQKN